MTEHHRARKRFGQHFLADQMVLSAIANAIAPQKDQHLVEIGPGQAALTEYIIDYAGRLDLIELDRDLIASLQAKFAKYEYCHIHQGDALKFDLAQLNTTPNALRIIGNLPYNISTPLIFHFLESIELIKDMTFLLQKEVVLRLTAEVGSSHYSRLSVMTQYYCQNQMLLEVGPEAFKPPPKVDSALVHMQPYAEPPCIASDVNVLRRVVTEAFNHRRKTIHNALKKMVGLDVLESLDLDLSLRPQDISVKNYVQISNAILLSKDSSR